MPKVGFTDYQDPSLKTNRGIVVQFVNTNCIDAASIIGAVRLPVQEITFLPEYLRVHEPTLKVHAVAALMRHLVSCQSPVGAGEKDLTVEDFSISFMVASISEETAQLNPSGRREAGLWICAYPWMARKVDFEVNDPLDHGEAVNRAYVINCYVHLLDPARRRRTVLKRVREDEEQEKRKIAVPHKKANKGSLTIRAVPLHQQSSKPNQANFPLTRKELQVKLDEANRVIAGLAVPKGQAAASSVEASFPQLPAPAVASNWGKNKLPKL